LTFDAELFEQLVELRLKIANEEGVPAYCVFHDSHLREMATTRPQTPSAFNQVRGVGEIKSRKYGNQFLLVIQNHSGRSSLSRIQSRSPTSETKQVLTDSEKEQLYQRLILVRKKLAVDARTSVATICGEYSLKHMLEVLPTDRQSFGRVNGIGEQRVRLYADAFIVCVTTFLTPNTTMPVGRARTTTAQPAAKQSVVTTNAAFNSSSYTPYKYYPKYHDLHESDPGTLWVRELKFPKMNKQANAISHFTSRIGELLSKREYS